MQNLLVWIYIINSVLLIVHEIDSAYWQEWKLFHIRGGIMSFLLLHVPLVFLVMWGLPQAAQGTWAGLIVSLILGIAGILAFSIHMVFIQRGHPEFRMPVSIAILVSTLIVSIAQITATLLVLANY